MADEPTAGELARRIDRTDRDVRDLRSDVPRWIADGIKPAIDDAAEVKALLLAHQQSHETAASAAINLSWVKLGVLATTGVGIASVLVTIMIWALNRGQGGSN